MMILHHIADTQVLYSNEAMLICILLSNFEMMVTALPFDLEVRLCRTLARFPAPMTPFLATTDRSLLTTECRLTGAIVTRVLHHVALTIGEEGRESYINTNVTMCALSKSMLVRRFGFADDKCVPMTICTQDQVGRFGCSL